MAPPDSSICQVYYMSNSARDQGGDLHGHAFDRRGSGGIHVFNPAGFDPEAVLGPELRRHADSARYLLGRIAWMRLNDRRYRERARRGDPYIPINAQKMRKFFASSPIYTRVRDRLIEGGVVVRDPRGYRVGRNSTGYAFGEALSARGLTMVEIK